ncbi:MAG: cupin domain-containing protein [Actinomycetota bacterium]|nr:cupin domain-containing protein [Actinomycetota bacterium]
MTMSTESEPRMQVLGPQDGQILGSPEGVRDRFLIDAKATGGRFSLVEHLMAPRSIAAPVHRHTREDEYTYVLEGRVGAMLGDNEVFAEVGDLIFKPRDQWHTFWNAGDSPARVLETICPGGLEELFRTLGLMTSEPDPETMAALAADYGCDVDFERTGPLMERHGLTF